MTKAAMNQPVEVGVKLARWLDAGKSRRGITAHVHKTLTRAFGEERVAAEILDVREKAIDREKVKGHRLSAHTSRGDPGCGALGIGVVRAVSNRQPARKGPVMSCERNPYLIDGPALISFSGGRTSAYLLKHILDAHGGTLPDDVVATFANTGLEHPATLDFVRDCATRWSVPVVWLEFDPTGANQRRFRVVDHATASRNGEPFEALVRKKGYLPNPVTRICTIELKIRVMRDFALSLGWSNWTNVLGLRYDEPRRVAKIANNRDRWENAAPLFDARVTKREVTAFWAAQSFDLGLPNVDGKTPHGNCVGCFLKSAKTLSALFTEEPSRADWWIRMERAVGATFRIDRPDYARMKEAALAQRPIDFGARDELTECLCHE